MTSSVGTEWPKERARLAVLIREYEALGPVGGFGAAALKDLARRADAAWESQEVVKILALFEEMRGAK